MYMVWSSCEELEVSENYKMIVFNCNTLLSTLPDSTTC